MLSTADALTTARVVSWGAMAVFTGGLAFVAALWPTGAQVRSARMTLSAAWFVGLLSTMASTGLQAAGLSGGSWSKAVDPDALTSLFKTRIGTAWATRDLLWLLGIVLLISLLQGGEAAAASWAWRVGGLAVGLGLIRSAGLVSHAPTSAHTTTGAIADFVHLVGVSLWLGGLVFLAGVLLPRGRADELALVVPRWSVVALLSVTTVIGAGTVMSWQLVGGFHALVSTHFGHVLLLKIAAVAVLLAVAYGSKVWVEHRLALSVVLDGDRATLRPFVLSVGAEAAVAVVVLTLAGLLVTSNPGA